MAWRAAAKVWFHWAEEGALSFTFTAALYANPGEGDGGQRSAEGGKKHCRRETVEGGLVY